jgi:GNAT superfamily N-acetyltransferase
MCESVILRPARPGEAPVFSQIEAICFPPAEAATPEQLEKRLAAFPENFLVAEKDGQAVGFINGANNDQPCLPDELYHDAGLHRREGAYQTVFGLDVLPEYRRQGIAQKLLQAYIALARERGKKGVILTCKTHLVHYYEKFGFVNHGVADSTHGGQVWYDMRLIF